MPLRTPPREKSEIASGVQGVVRAYPNPFTAATGIRFTLPQAGRVAVEVIDRKTRVLLFASGPMRDCQFLRNQLHRDKTMVVDVLLQTAVSLVNLGMRRAGLTPGTEDERDLGQVQAAIDGVQALIPILERRGREEVRPIRDALAQLQLVYARQAGGAEGEPTAQPPGREGAQPPGKQGPGPAQGSGRLWVPGQ